MNSLNLNIYNTIILAGIIQGVIFGFIILYTKKYASKTNTFIAYTVLALSGSNLQYWFSDTGLSNRYLFLEWTHIPFELLIIPSFYIFVNYYIEKDIAKKTIPALISPFIISSTIHIIIALDYFIYDNALLPKTLKNIYFIAEEFFSFGFSLLLLTYIIVLIYKYEKEGTKPTKNIRAETKWLKHILFIGLGICIFWLFEILYMQTKNNTGFAIFYPLWISISFLVYWISYAGIFHSNLLLQRRYIHKRLITHSLISSDQQMNPQAQNDKLFEAFNTSIKNSYLNPNLSLDDVAKDLGISSNYLSQIISHKNIKFNDYINLMRIEKVKTLLHDNSFAQYSVTAIGLEAGFNSKASFYRAFKKHTGATPTQFRASKD